MSANAPDPGEGPPSADRLKEAQDALDGAAQLGEPSRAGRLEKEFLDSVNAAGQATGSSDGLGILMQGVDALVESLPPLVRALDAVAQVHPFLAVAVGAFKVVIELEAKRRDNDKKVNLLFLEMRNMMAALLQLHDVRTNHVGRDGLSIGARLDDLVKKTATDIKECANACDTYARKRLLVKVLKAPSWDGKLKEYIQLFSDRKGEFNFAISIHTGLGVDRANEKLDTLITKVDVVIEFFEKTVSREQCALAEAIRLAGGAQAVLAKPEALQTLLLKEQQLEAAALPPPDDSALGLGARADSGAHARRRSGAYYYSRAAENQRVRRRTDTTRRGEYAAYGGYEARRQTHAPRRARDRSFGFPGRDQWPEGSPRGGEEDGEGEGSVGLKRLMRDLADEPAVAMRRNFVWFERKFAIQQRELVREMTRVVVHEGDRVISSVLAGPHERIIDPDLYEIWRDMRWRGIVKARHLVLAIHDHYTQRLDDQRRAVAQGTTPQRPISDDDLWALECLDLMHLQQVIEGLDPDASGFVTIQEVNTFTTSRPQGWSLLHWLAYWAVGWQVAMAEYRSKIHALLARMGDLCTAVRGRGYAVEAYLAEVVPAVKAMTTSFCEDPERRFLLDRFRGYVQEEERRLREGLETAKYDLDALDTLALINGPRGIERNLFVMLYLLLRRHYDVMSVGKTVILHPEELSDAASTLLLVKDAFDYRVQDLTGLFTQRRLTVYVELGEFACGMLSDSYRRTQDYDAQTVDLVGAIDDPDLGEKREAPSETILKYPSHLEDFYPESDDGVDSEGADISEELKPLLGHWAGVQISEIMGTVYSYPSISLDFHISPVDRNQVVAVPLLMRSWTCTRATVTGTFAGLDEDGRLTYILYDSYNVNALPDIFSKVVLSEDGTTLQGEQDTVLSFDTPGPKSLVVLKRGSSPEVMQFYPLPSELQDDKPRPLWTFALSATLYDVRRRRFSWEFIKERRDRKHTLGSILHAESRRTSLHRDDVAVRLRLMGATTPADLHLFLYAAVEPAKFPWVRPWCAQCARVLRTLVPCLRCTVCTLPGGDAACVALCHRGECLRSHVEGYGDHFFLKTREEGWMLGRFMEEKGLDEGKLRGMFSRALVAVRGEQDVSIREYGSRRSRSPPSPSRHSLWTITERTEASSESALRSDLRGFDVAEPPDAEEPPTTSRRDAAIRLGDVRDLSHPLEISHQDSNVSESAPPVTPPSPMSPMAFTRGTSLENSWTQGPFASDAGVRMPQTTKPRCISCNATMALPCWVCVECPDMTCICHDCDELHKGGNSLGGHKERHVLLRIWSSGTSPRSLSRFGYRSRSRSPYRPVSDVLEAQLSAMEHRLGAVESRFGRIEERMDGFESRLVGVDDRLTRIDDMLTTVLSLLRRDGQS